MRFLYILMTIAAIICISGLEAESLADTDFPSGSISGIVADLQSGEPISGAVVEVTKNGFSIGISKQTDLNGKYILEEAPVGIFDVTVSKANCMAEVISDINVEEGKDTPNINVFLKLLTPIKVGEEARDFSLGTVDGKMFTLSDFKGKNAVVLGIGDPYG